MSKSIELAEKWVNMHRATSIWFAFRIGNDMLAAAPKQTKVNE